MTHLEAELQQLKEAVNEMMTLVESQLIKSREALLNLDKDMAQEIIHYESRVNAIELSIDRDCENIFALFNPVAVDLRLVLALLKMNSELERIGDHADGIAKYVLEMEKHFTNDLIKKIELEMMYDTAISMVADSNEALVSEDTKLARTIFKKDQVLNKINRNASSVIQQFAAKQPASIGNLLYLFSLIQKLERVGDLCKNIAEETIFYIEAKVIKHKKKKVNNS